MRKILRKSPILYKLLRFAYNLILTIFHLILFFFTNNFNKKIYHLTFLLFSDNQSLLKLSNHYLIKFLAKNKKINDNNLLKICSYLILSGKQNLSLKLMKQYNVRKNIKRINYKTILEKYRFFSSNNFGAIGHISFIDFYIKSDKLKLTSNKKNILLDDFSKFANPSIIKMYSADLDLSSKGKEISNKIDANKKKYVMEELGLMPNSFGKYVWLDEWAWGIQKEWILKNGLIPSYKLGIEINKSAEKKLAKYGFNKNMWFVVLHIREDGGGKIRGLRNSNPSSYEGAIKNIIDKGGWVFRIGGNSLNKTIKIESNYYVDLSKSGEVIPELDAYLLSKCRFFLGTGSGPINIAAHFFCRPVLLTNAAPLASRIPWPNQLLLPKMYKSMKTNKIMNLSTRINDKFGTIESVNALENLGYKTINNTKEQIVYASNEMLNLTKNNSFDITILNKNKKQIIFKNLSSKNNSLCPIYCSEIIFKEYPNFLN